jgi:tetrapyrrole methylase family protein/MazG family protein
VARGAAAPAGPEPLTGSAPGKPTGSPLGLRRIVHHLRAPGGCPWDREQTPTSLVRYVLEEAYEVADAIEASDPLALREELGDLLLQVYLQAEIAEENGQFDLTDVIRSLSEKLIRRHPHVFAGLQVGDAQAVELNWERLKQAEKGQPTSVLDRIPRSLPALARSQEVQRRLGQAGFDWPDSDGAWAKLDEELTELRQARGDSRTMADELGDVLFILAKLATDAGLDAEAALRACNQRVAHRFRHLEQAAAARGTTVEALGLPIQLQLWNDAKQSGLENSL